MPAALLQAMRPHQWVKNLLVFAPLLFAHKYGESAALLRSLLAFAVFCLLASGLYLINDVADRDADRNHPRKRLRPVASGRLPVPAALAGAAVLVAVAATAGSFLGSAFLVWPAAYALLTTTYTALLKRIAVLDCMSIAVGFVLRVEGGSAALAVDSSSWILMCTFFFALFLAFCKRREEVRRQPEFDGMTRASLRDYDFAFLDQVIGPLGALSILSYALYTVAPRTVEVHGPGGKNLIYTVPFVVFGVFRYLYLVYRRDEGDDPSRLLFRDPPLVATGALYAATVYAFLH